MNKRNYVPNQPKAFWSLTKRHLLVFLKNVPSVIFTLMVPLTVLAVYIVFLRPMEIAQIKQTLIANGIIYDTATEAGELFLHGVYGIADTWMISGVLSVSCITVSLNANVVLVRDKEREIAKDFISSPILPTTIVSSYFLFNLIVTFVTNLIVYFICLIYLACYGAYMITLLDFFAIIGVILYSSVSASLLMFFICSFITTESVMSPIVAIVSAAVGFLIGAFLPSGTGPVYIEYVTMFFPGTYSTGLFRNYFMRNPLAQLKKAPELSSEAGQKFVENLENQFSLNLNFFGHRVNPTVMSLVILLFITVFAVLCCVFSSKNYMNFSRKISLKKKKKVQDAQETKEVDQ